jgi:hypothetical protein
MRSPLNKPKFQRRIPWLSLSLLFGTYAMLGRLVVAPRHNPNIFWFVGLGGVLVALLYLHPLTDLARLRQRWFTSDTVAFGVMILTAAMASILFNWFKVFLPIVMVLLVEALARLDLSAGEYTEWQTFMILIFTTAIGLAFGYFISI